MSRIGRTVSPLGSFSQQIPGLTVYTPVTQLGVRQWPALSGVGDVQSAINAVLGPSTTPPASNSGDGILLEAENFVSGHPLPVLVLLGYLLFVRR